MNQKDRLAKTKQEIRYEQLKKELATKRVKLFRVEAEITDKDFIREADLRTMQTKKREHATLTRESESIERMLLKISERMS